MKMKSRNGKEEPGTEIFGHAGYLKINILGFALTALWTSLHSIILPIRIIELVPESQKNTYLGILTLSGLLLAMIVQPVFGVISDRSHSSLGRRRPYILLGACLALLFVPGTGLGNSYVLTFVAYCLLQVSCNIAQASYQAFIPEMVPFEKRGTASGIKTLLEVLGGVVMVRLIAYFMGRYFGGEGALWFWMSLGILMFVLLSAAVLTVVSVKEQAGNQARTSYFSYEGLKIDFKVRHDLLWFLVSRSLMGIPGVVLQIFTMYYLMDVVGIRNPAAMAGDLLVVAGVCLLAAVYPAGRISDKVGRRPVIIASGMVGAGGIVLLFFARSNTPLMLAGGLLGVANGAMLSSTWALATDLAKKNEEAKYLGLTGIAVSGGSALARLMGPVIDFFNGISSGLGYQVMLLVCLLGFIIGALLVVKIKDNC